MSYATAGQKKVVRFSEGAARVTKEWAISYIHAQMVRAWW